MPIGQREQKAWPAPENVPAAQAVACEAKGVAQADPAGQRLHVVAPAALTEPKAQATGWAPGDGQADPSGQGEQAVWLAKECSPGEQATGAAPGLGHL